ncbi:helix-turn-helix domain-containing protein [Candidatus Accumulibacter sp. ACC003]|uniref:helix-turn-helix domain-containing protein n=1 Tax=Candidatus Accumulibacter sp. ACC003 TaxID=2823334 RepID=UPI0025C2D3F9|nr:helix-turn-helix domain-containing protein [Candidatus Accumulibacter sp. ACC003]
MGDSLKYDDCGLKNICLANGFQYQNLEGLGRCLEIDDVDGLHRAIGHHLVDYKRRLTGAEIRFLRVEMGVSQKRLGDCLGVDEQSVSSWERSKRRPTVAAERMLRLMYLEQVDGATRVVEVIAQWSDSDRQKDDGRQLFEKSASGWRPAV